MKRELSRYHLTVHPAELAQVGRPERKVGVRGPKVDQVRPEVHEDDRGARPPERPPRQPDRPVGRPLLHGEEDAAHGTQEGRRDAARRPDARQVASEPLVVQAQVRAPGNEPTAVRSDAQSHEDHGTLESRGEGRRAGEDDAEALAERRRQVREEAVEEAQEGEGGVAARNGPVPDVPEGPTYLELEEVVARQLDGVARDAHGEPHEEDHEAGHEGGVPDVRLDGVDPSSPLATTIAGRVPAPPVPREYPPEIRHPPLPPEMVRVVQALGEVPPHGRVGWGVVHVAVMEARLERTAGRPVEVSTPAAGVPLPGPAGRQDALVAPEQGRGSRALPGPQSPERAERRPVVGTDEGAHPRLRGGRPLRLPVRVLKVRRAFPRAVRLVASRPDEPAAFPQWRRPWSPALHAAKVSASGAASDVSAPSSKGAPGDAGGEDAPRPPPPPPPVDAREDRTAARTLSTGPSSPPRDEGRSTDRRESGRGRGEAASSTSSYADDAVDVVESIIVPPCRDVFDGRPSSFGLFVDLGSTLRIFLPRRSPGSGQAEKSREKGPPGAKLGKWSASTLLPASWADGTAVAR
ncbi:hypothetical protein THAOC_20064 [Thalassiosira oceanica]|uniref:Uncharacterized protein n=1 Tax=Thalassiosira oceanica TaxID=159749 RepID=K0S4C1_THAOC|nr:hypothetical protein THAOC_20064 [Thalassiosira oceanica]|eukprot:EJK59669.1 hypothetical protein THAOC_20064 [Thalassiosira oceanica]